MEASLFGVDPGEPLAPWWCERSAPASGLRAWRFEFTSRGDRVPGRLLLPEAAAGPVPLVLAQHGLGRSKDDPAMDTACVPWVRAGAAVATVDFPLHGERASAKLGQRLVGAVSGTRELDPLSADLWVQFVRQAVADLRRALDVLALRPELDAGRIAYAGFSLGTVIGVPFCAEEPRVRAAALAIGGGGAGPAAVDPALHVSRLAPRPLLFVNALRDETVSRERAEALHAAAGASAEVLWFDAPHAALPGAALKAMWRFLARSLELGEAAGSAAPAGSPTPRGSASRAG